MTLSVGIIAHNEEGNITKCLSGILRGSILPTEIVVVAHNCTDSTIAKAKDFLVEHCPADITWRVDDYHGPEGIIYARIRLFSLVSGEIVACIDGGCLPSKAWLQQLVRPLREDSTVGGVGGFSLVWGHLASIVMSINFFFLFPITKPDQKFYFWGSDFACRKSLYSEVGGLEPLIDIRKKIGLKYWAEDLYLSTALSQIGRVVFSPRAIVTSRGHSMKLTQWLERSRHQDIDRIKLQSFMS